MNFSEKKGCSHIYLTAHNRLSLSVPIFVRFHQNAFFLSVFLRRILRVSLFPLALFFATFRFSRRRSVLLGAQFVEDLVSSRHHLKICNFPTRLLCNFVGNVEAKVILRDEPTAIYRYKCSCPAARTNEGLTDERFIEDRHGRGQQHNLSGAHGNIPPGAFIRTKVRGKLIMSLLSRPVLSPVCPKKTRGTILEAATPSSEVRCCSRQVKRI